MKRALGIAMLLMLAFSLPTDAFASKTKVIERKFDRVESLKIDLVLGGCVIRQHDGRGISISVEYTYDDDEFEARFKERGNTLHVKEKLYGEDVDGESEWIIEVPKSIDIEFQSATGSLEISGLKGTVEANSGTGSITVSGCDGDIEVHSGTGNVTVSGSEGEFHADSGTGKVVIEDSEGEFKANSGTGSVVIEKSKGDFQANSGTGNVEAHGLTVRDFGEFNSGTGRAEIDLPDGDDYELEIGSGTGKAVVDCRGSDLNARVEMTARKHHGKISSSFRFDDEEEFYQDDDKYVRKSLADGNGKRSIEIRTGTGTARLKK